jgi:hypothetical protein
MCKILSLVPEDFWVDGSQPTVKKWAQAQWAEALFAWFMWHTHAGLSILVLALQAVQDFLLSVDRHPKWNWLLFILLFLKLTRFILVSFEESRSLKNIMIKNCTKEVHCGISTHATKYTLVMFIPSPFPNNPGPSLKSSWDTDSPQRFPGFLRSPASLHQVSAAFLTSASAHTSPLTIVTAVYFQMLFVGIYEPLQLWGQGLCTQLSFLADTPEHHGHPFSITEQSLNGGKKHGGKLPWCGTVAVTPQWSDFFLEDL